MAIPPEVTVRYWAAARDAASTAEERCAAHSLGELVAAVGARHGPQMQRLLEVCSFIVDERPARASETPLGPGSIVEVLPPFAGGSPRRRGKPCRGTTMGTDAA